MTETTPVPSPSAPEAVDSEAGRAGSDGFRVRHVFGLLLFFVVVGALPPEALYWDGIGFLEWARADPIRLDYGHTLYTPLLRLAYTGLNAVWYATWEFAAKLLSSAGAALFFVLLWRRLERRLGRRFGQARTGEIPAFALAALCATTPLFWRQAGLIEPTTWTLAALLVAASAAERYGRVRSLARAWQLAGALALLAGFHVVSVFALPWIAWLARGPAELPPRRHLGVPLVLVGAGVLVLALFGKLGELAAFPAYWRGFLPGFDLASVGVHLTVLRDLAWIGFPLVLVAGGLGVAASGLGAKTGTGTPARTGPHGSNEALVLAAPYLLAFLFFGAPRVGLSIPLTLALTLAAADGLSALGARPLARLAVAGLLPLLLAVQLGQGMASGLERARTPDDLQVEAELLAGALPADAVLLAGTTAHHLMWFTGAPVVALPNELHAATPGPDGRVDAVALVHAIAAREAARHARVYVSSEAIDYLIWRWLANPSELRVDPEGTILVRRDPELYLVPLLPTPTGDDSLSGAH